MNNTIKKRESFKKIKRSQQRRCIFYGILIFILFIVFLLALFIASKNSKNMLLATAEIPQESTVETIEEYNLELSIPIGITGEFKTYMDYRKITNKQSKQWHLQQLAKTDYKGFRKFNNNYLVAVGSFYATEVGKELLITLDNGYCFKAMVGDLKKDIHTDCFNQYVEENGNIVEFIVDTKALDKSCLKAGDVSGAGFYGKIIKIEEVK